jgi:lipopolysaccharide transport system permease protein
MPTTMLDTKDTSPFIAIRPPGRFSAMGLREFWQFRDLLRALAVRDLKVRYKQTALGVIWVVLQPLMGALAFTFVFGFLAKMPSGDVPYLLFAYAGMLGWQVFSGTLTKASDCIVGNSALVSKVYFPRLILPLSTVLSTLIDFAVSMVLMVILLLCYGIKPGLNLLLLPVPLGLLILLAIGFGLYTSALMVTYRDLRHVMPMIIQLLMYASPIVYPLALVQEKIQKYPSLLTLYFMNPMVELLQSLRWSLLGTETVQWGWLGYSAIVVVGIFMFGALAFKRMERRFADVI